MIFDDRWPMISTNRINQYYSPLWATRHLSGNQGCAPRLVSIPCSPWRSTREAQAWNQYPIHLYPPRLGDDPRPSGWPRAPRCLPCATKARIGPGRGPCGAEPVGESAECHGAAPPWRGDMTWNYGVWAIRTYDPCWWWFMLCWLAMAMAMLCWVAIRTYDELVATMGV